MNNSLSVVHPELIVEWSKKNLPLTPDGITFGSNKVVWWKGSCGHEWQTTVARSLNPTSTLLWEQYGQPEPLILLLLTDAVHSCPSRHFQMTFL